MQQVSTDASDVAEEHPGPLLARFQPTAPADASKLLAEIYGIDGTALKLSSELDETFAVTAADGRRFVLKIASPAERREILSFQDGALVHLDATAAHLPVPRLMPSLRGERCPALQLAGGGVRLVRLLSYLDGRQLWEVPATATQLTNLGQLVGQLGLALATYRPRVPDVDLLWDVSRADRLLPMLEYVADPARRQLVAGVLDGFREDIGAIASQLPRQVIHNDVNPYNILVAGADPDRVTGIIDFGDLVEAPRVNDIAIALSYHIGKPAGPELVRAFLAGYRRHVQLERVELHALATLVRTRLAMTIVITEWRSRQRPENARYILRNHPAALAGLERLSDFTPRRLRELFEECEP